MMQTPINLQFLGSYTLCIKVFFNINLDVSLFRSNMFYNNSTLTFVLLYIVVMLKQCHVSRVNFNSNMCIYRCKLIVCFVLKYMIM